MPTRGGKNSKHAKGRSKGKASKANTSAIAKKVAPIATVLGLPLLQSIDGEAIDFDGDGSYITGVTSTLPDTGTCTARLRINDVSRNHDGHLFAVSRSYVLSHAGSCRSVPTCADTDP